MQAKTFWNAIKIITNYKTSSGLQRIKLNIVKLNIVKNVVESFSFHGDSRYIIKSSLRSGGGNLEATCHSRHIIATF